MANIVFVYRDFSYASHVGLGINALHSVRVLSRHGVTASYHQVATAEEIGPVIDAERGCTHCIVEALWVSGPQLAVLLRRYPRVRFVVRCHSQVGFLQVEPGAIVLIRDVLDRQETATNLSFASNSRRFVAFVERAYAARCLYLPNLYDLEGTAPVVRRVGGEVQIGSFGALRVQKNHATAAAAAMLLARNIGTDLAFYISTGREQHGAGVKTALRNLFAELRWARLVEVPWQPWPAFRRTIAEMDVCFQLSMTETFNLVTADATAAGVPTVVSESIDWLPDDWMAAPDDVESAARVGGWLLHDANAGAEGRMALAEYVGRATTAWLDYLSG